LDKQAYETPKDEWMTLWGAPKTNGKVRSRKKGVPEAYKGKKGKERKHRRKIKRTGSLRETVVIVGKTKLKRVVRSDAKRDEKSFIRGNFS